jgi:hypothetical protein
VSARRNQTPTDGSTSNDDCGLSEGVLVSRDDLLSSGDEDRGEVPASPTETGAKCTDRGDSSSAAPDGVLDTTEDVRDTVANACLRAGALLGFKRRVVRAEQGRAAGGRDYPLQRQT